MYTVKLYIFVQISEKNSHFNLLVLEASNSHSKPVIKDTSNTFTHKVLFEIFRFETHLLARARKDSRKFTFDRSKGRGLRLEKCFHHDSSTLEDHLLPWAKYSFEFLFLFANSSFSEVTAAVIMRAEHATHGHYSFN